MPETQTADVNDLFFDVPTDDGPTQEERIAAAVAKAVGSDKEQDKPPQQPPQQQQPRPQPQYQPPQQPPQQQAMTPKEKSQFDSLAGIYTRQEELPDGTVRDYVPTDVLSKLVEEKSQRLFEERAGQYMPALEKMHQRQQRDSLISQIASDIKANSPHLIPEGVDARTAASTLVAFYNHPDAQDMNDAERQSWAEEQTRRHLLPDGNAKPTQREDMPSGSGARIGDRNVAQDFLSRLPKQGKLYFATKPPGSLEGGYAEYSKTNIQSSIAQDIANKLGYSWDIQIVHPSELPRGVVNAANYDWDSLEKALS